MSDAASSRLAAPRLAAQAFWFLRHGETDWNAQLLSQGSIDIPLNPNGLAQARLAAEKLRGLQIASIVASPLTRARITAEIAAAAVGVPVQFDPELQEASFGVQEGQPMSEWFDDWVFERATPEGAESFAALRIRAVRAVNRALALPHPVLIVAHGALFRALRAEMGLPPREWLPNAVPVWCKPGAPAWTLAVI